MPRQPKKTDAEKRVTRLRRDHARLAAAEQELTDAGVRGHDHNVARRNKNRAANKLREAEAEVRKEQAKARASEVTANARHASELPTPEVAAKALAMGMEPGFFAGPAPVTTPPQPTDGGR